MFQRLDPACVMKLRYTDKELGNHLGFQTTRMLLQSTYNHSRVLQQQLLQRRDPSQRDHQQHQSSEQYSAHGPRRFHLKHLGRPLSALALQTPLTPSCSVHRRGLY